MVIRSMRNATIAIFWIVGPMVLPSAAQQPAAGTSAVQVIGLAGVKHKTKNGVVVLTGKVPAAATRSQAELAASQIANVQQVVNEIETKN